MVNVHYTKDLLTLIEYLMINNKYLKLNAICFAINQYCLSNKIIMSSKEHLVERRGNGVVNGNNDVTVPLTNSSDDLSNVEDFQ